MDKTRFMEIVSELIMTEIEEVCLSSVKYDKDKAKEIIVRFNNQTEFKITLTSDI